MAMRADAPVFVPKSSLEPQCCSISQPTNQHDDPSKQSQFRTKKKKKSQRSRRRAKTSTETSGDTTSSIVDAADPNDETSLTKEDVASRDSVSEKRRYNGRRTYNNKVSGGNENVRRENLNHERKKPTKENFGEKPKDKRSRTRTRRRRNRQAISNKHNSQRRQRGDREDGIYVEKGDGESIHHGSTEDFLDSEAFPSLSNSGPSVPTAEVLNHYLGDESDLKQWSSIAHQGHLHSETLNAQRIREYERRMHEIETHTTMEVLGDSMKIEVMKDNLIDLREDEPVDNETSEQIEHRRGHNSLRSMTVTALNVEKLRTRWNKAFREWQIIEEKRQELKRDFELSHQREQVAMEEIGTVGSYDSSTDDDSEVDGDDFHFTCDLREQESSNIPSTEIQSASKCAKFLEMEFPLHYAIVHNDEEAVKDLILLPPQTILRDERIALDSLIFPDGCKLPTSISRIGTKVSVMHLAILLNLPNLLKIMLSSSGYLNHVTSTFSLDDQDDCKRTPLMLATEFSLDECIRVLLSYGPKLSMKHPRTGDCVMHIACRYAEPSTVELILSRERNTARQRLICCRNRVGDTAMHVVATRGRIDILEAILLTCSTASVDKASAITDRLDRTPLLLAIISGESDIVNALLTWRGNHRGAASHSKYCPLTLAVGTKSLEMIDLILECKSRSIWNHYDYTGALCKVIHCFEESSEDPFEIMKLLIEEGADPYKKICYHSGDSSFFGSSALEFAAMKGKVKFVAKMMDYFSRIQRDRIKLMREDPALRSKNLAYFKSVEEREKNNIQQSVEDTLIKVMVSIVVDGETCLRRLGSCLAMIRRASRLSDDKFVRFLRGIRMREGVLQSPDALAPDEAIFWGQYIHNIPRCMGHTEVIDNSYDRSFAQGWTTSYMELDWIRHRTVHETINCLNMKEDFPSPMELAGPSLQNGHGHFDICNFVIEGRRLQAHRTILSQKSAKLEAAIRFAEMKHEQSEEDDDIVEVHLDLSLEQFFFLVSHCYNGSITAGLDPSPAVCCQQLLDLYFVANEYLCSSLANECEMRLLSRNPYKCHCWYCCDKVEKYGNGNEVVCHYSVQGPSKLLSVDNYLGVVSSIQDVNNIDSSYSIVRKGTVGFTDASFPPLSVLSSIVWKSVLLNFRALMKTESYITLCHDAMADDDDLQITPEYFERFGDQFGTLLLQMVLEQLTQVPPELVFMTPKSSEPSFLGQAKS